MDLYIKKINEHKKVNGQPLSKATIKTYTTNINAMVNDHGWDWSIPALTNWFETKSLVNRSKNNYINAILNYYEVMDSPKETIKLLKTERDKYNKIIETEPNINPKKKENLVEWDIIIKWRDLVKESNALIFNGLGEVPIEDLQVEAILHLLTKYQRRNEIADLKYFDTEVWSNPAQVIGEQDNYIFHNKHTDKLFLIFKDYKTQEIYKKQVFEIDDPTLKNLLIYYIQQNEYDTFMWRAPMTKEPLTRLNLTKLLNRSSKKWLKKTISTTMIRNSFNTTKYKDIKQELYKDCEIQAHSIATKMKHYVKD